MDRLDELRLKFSEVGLLKAEYVNLKNDLEREYAYLVDDVNEIDHLVHELDILCGKNGIINFKAASTLHDGTPMYYKKQGGESKFSYGEFGQITIDGKIPITIKDIINKNGTFNSNIVYIDNISKNKQEIKDFIIDSVMKEVNKVHDEYQSRVDVIKYSFDTKVFSTDITETLERIVNGIYSDSELNSEKMYNHIKESVKHIAGLAGLMNVNVTNIEPKNGYWDITFTYKNMKGTNFECTLEVEYPNRTLEELEKEKDFYMPERNTIEDDGFDLEI